MSKEPDMSDELTKLARKEWEAIALGKAMSRYIELRLQSHHAAEKAKAFIMAHLGGCAMIGSDNDVIAALDALILTPPVDPLEEAVRGAAMAMPGEWEAFPGECEKFAIKLRGELAKRGIELRTVADGGGA